MAWMRSQSVPWGGAEGLKISLNRCDHPHTNTQILEGGRAEHTHTYFLGFTRKPGLGHKVGPTTPHHPIFPLGVSFLGRANTFV